MVRKLAIAASCIAIAIHILYLPCSTITYEMLHPGSNYRLGETLLAQTFFGIISTAPFFYVLTNLWRTSNASAALVAVAAALASDAYFEMIVRASVAAGDGQSGFGYIFALVVNLILVIAICNIGGWIASLMRPLKTDA